MKFILASSSPRRLEILQKLNITPDDIISPDIDETCKKGETPTSYVKRVALEKATVVYKNNPQNIVLSGDTIVVKGTRIIGKAGSLQEAREILTLISGSRHKVLTSFCIYHPKSEKPILKTVQTSVLVKNLSKDEIQWYLNSKEWEGKSGCYAIQGKFESFVKQINGSISNVVGLPLAQVYNSLKGIGYLSINNTKSI